eukprot:TRINITY_DN5041_c0_g1_i1.p1 TRINITY_DN5041_c0_g1~~TRINITY_DN5041_c0_g1_i1.p1  ORF type:complete len:206 (-),score=30.94 TRINITY_DN5041_c0_g1_i1:28-645(-)
MRKQSITLLRNCFSQTRRYKSNLGYYRPPGFHKAEPVDIPNPKPHVSGASFLENFVDAEGKQHTGRAWTASELRLKSFEDLHKLWFVLLKEKNRFNSILRASGGKRVPGFFRGQKIRSSMLRIKVVLKERMDVYKKLKAQQIQAVEHGNLEQVRAIQIEALTKIRSRQRERLRETRYNRFNGTVTEAFEAVAGENKEQSFPPTNK